MDELTWGEMYKLITRSLLELLGEDKHEDS